MSKKSALRGVAIATLALAAGGCGGGGGTGNAVFPGFALPPAGQPPAPSPSGPQNAAPTAVAPSTAAAWLSAAVVLDGSGSTDPEGSQLSYAWSLESSPAGSAAQLVDAASAKARIVADAVGPYRFKLIVSDGEKTSAPAYVDLTVTAPAPSGPLLSFKTSGFEIYSASMGGCNYARSAPNFATFWSFRSDPFEMNCGGVRPSPETPDVALQGAYGGGQLDRLAEGVGSLARSGISGTTSVTRINDAISGYEYTLTAQAARLAAIPLDKATGTVFNHSTFLAYAQPSSRGVLQYRLEGTAKPANAPPGWEASGATSVSVTLSGTTLVDGKPEPLKVKLLEKTFTEDFAETIPLELDLAKLPSFTGNYAAYILVVSNRVAFRRLSD